MKDEYVPDIYVGELISRQAALEAAIKADMENHNGILSEKRARVFEEHISILPTVQPEITHEQAIDYLHKTGWLQSHDRILTEHEQMYKKAFSVACELLIGANLFGVTEETMFREIMEKDGIVSSHSYEKYILDNLARLTGEDDGTD